jgi:hypothetical protein
MDRNSIPGADKRMIILGPGGVTIDRAQLEDLMRTESEELVRDMAIEVWRTRRRFDRLSADARQSAQTLSDSLARLEDVLTEHDVRCTIHDGEVYDTGLAVEVLEVQGDRDKPQVVTETVRPAVTWKGRTLCRAQVVVSGGEANA